MCFAVFALEFLYKVLGEQEYVWFAFLAVRGIKIVKTLRR